MEDPSPPPSLKLRRIRSFMLVEEFPSKVKRLDEACNNCTGSGGDDHREQSTTGKICGNGPQGRGLTGWEVFVRTCQIKHAIHNGL